MAKLNAYVHVQDEQGQMHVFGPADEVPGWAAKRITNPKAWAEAPETGGGEQSNGEPPRSGKGSGREAWATYAAEQGVDVPDDATREDIIAALVDAGKIQE